MSTADNCRLSVNSLETENQKTVVVRIDPSTINKSIFSKSKINKVYVVPSSAKKSVHQKLCDPVVEVIDASAYCDSSVSSYNKMREFAPGTDKIQVIQVPISDAKCKQNIITAHESNYEKDSPSASLSSEEDEGNTEDLSIQISPTQKNGAEVEITEHEILADSEVDQEIFEVQKENNAITNYDDDDCEEPLADKQNIDSAVNLKGGRNADEHLELAIQDVLRSNMSVKRAAHVHGIRYSVLVSKINKAGAGEKGPLGADTALTEKEEQALVEWIKNRYKSGCPVKKIDLANRVAEIVSDGRATRFKNGTPGEKWFTNFMIRNPSVATLGPTTRCDSREMPSKQSLLSWFNRCDKHMRVFGQENILRDPKRVGCVEELTLCLVSSETKVSNSKGSRVSTLFLPNEKSGNIMVLLGACADGLMTPPMPVFSCRKPPPALIHSIPTGWGIGLSKDGNINKEVVHSYFKNILIPWLDEQDRLPFILFIDKIKSFLSIETADFCSQNGILIYNFPMNSCKVLQPLHTSVMQPIKKSWGPLSTHKNDKEALLQFCPTLNQLLCDSSPPYIISQSFLSCGIHPFDPKEPDYSKCLLIKDGRANKNFSGNDYAISLEVFEDLIGRPKIEIFRETLKGFKLLKSEDGALYKVWHRLVAKVDVAKTSSELEEYRHERIIRGGKGKLPRRETYLMVLEEGEENSMQNYRTFNDISLTHAAMSSTELSDKRDGVEIDAGETTVDVFPKGNVKDRENSAFCKDHYSVETKKCQITKEKAKEIRKGKKAKRERAIALLEQDETVSKKLKKAIAPKYCSQCLADKGKLIKCMVCNNFIHFDCMMEEEQQIMSDLYKDDVDFDYICPSCS